MKKHLSSCEVKFEYSKANPLIKEFAFKVDIKKPAYSRCILNLVELIGIEPMTSCVQGRRSPS